MRVLATAGSLVVSSLLFSALAFAQQTSPPPPPTGETTTTVTRANVCRNNNFIVAQPGANGGQPQLTVSCNTANTGSIQATPIPANTPGIRGSECVQPSTGQVDNCFVMFCQQDSSRPVNITPGAAPMQEGFDSGVNGCTRATAFDRAELAGSVSDNTTVGQSFGNISAYQGFGTPDDLLRGPFVTNTDSNFTQGVLSGFRDGKLDVLETAEAACPATGCTGTALENLAAARTEYIAAEMRASPGLNVEELTRCVNTGTCTGTVAPDDTRTPPGPPPPTGNVDDGRRLGDQIRARCLAAGITDNAACLAFIQGSGNTFNPNNLGGLGGLGGSNLSYQPCSPIEQMTGRCQSLGNGMYVRSGGPGGLGQQQCNPIQQMISGCPNMFGQQQCGGLMLMMNRCPQGSYNPNNPQNPYGYPQPTCSMQITPQSAPAGQAVTLQWQSQNAQYASLSSSGQVGPNGSMQVYPQGPTTYTMTVVGYGNQQGQCQAQFGQGSGTGGGQPTAEISCQPQTADIGMQVAISYACQNATAASGTGFSTDGALSGSKTITLTSPPLGTHTQTFGISCSNQGLVHNAQCTININKSAIVLVANPKKVSSGEKANIGWVTSGMSTCRVSSPTLQQFTDDNATLTGTSGATKTPALNTTSEFVLTCETKSGATKSATTTVTVQ